MDTLLDAFREYHHHGFFTEETKIRLNENNYNPALIMEQFRNGESPTEIRIKERGFYKNG